MKIHASGEDYLEVIIVLQKKIGMVRSVDLAKVWGKVTLYQRRLLDRNITRLIDTKGMNRISGKPQE